MRGGFGSGVALAALGLALAGGATADIFRCVRPDGSVTFTDDESSCRGARPHAVKDAIQHVAPGRPPSRSGQTGRGRAQRPASLQQQAEQGAAARWRARKLGAQSELEQLAERREHLSRFVTHCNHGRDLFTVKENGLKTAVSCERIRADLADVEARQVSVRQYLEGGLEEECRRAGCKPGWVR